MLQEAEKCETRVDGISVAMGFAIRVVCVCVWNARCGFVILLEGSPRRIGFLECAGSLGFC